jgi:dienelactone hydrolase
MRNVAILSLGFIIGFAPAFGQAPATLDVRQDGLVAHMHQPAGRGRVPAVLLVGGSGGGIGWQDEMAALLAERGFAALALAYFGMDGLPKELDRIPLEYFDRALAWLARRPDVDPKRIAIGGVSKGGELALLIASRHPEIRGVAVFVPSGIVFQSIASGYPKTSSWSFQGKDLPFVAYGKVDNPKSTAEIYRAGLEQAEESKSMEAAVIPVERINGPILLLSGQEDNLWPSTMLSEMIVARLRSHMFRYPVEHTAYPEAGHLISSIRKDNVTRRGGTPEGNRRAQEDGQRRFLEFFRRALDLK